MAILLPSDDNETENPELSSAASPSISLPNCVHTPPDSEYIRTCPASFPFPSFLVAPMATLLPSDDNETEIPDRSSAASPSISLPIWVHSPPDSEYIRTCPALMPVPLLFHAPMATLLPSDDNETETPDWLPEASPSISMPICVHGWAIVIELIVDNKTIIWVNNRTTFFIQISYSKYTSPCIVNYRYTVYWVSIKHKVL